MSEQRAEYEVKGTTGVDILPGAWLKIEVPAPIGEGEARYYEGFFMATRDGIFQWMGARGVYPSTLMSEPRYYRAQVEYGNLLMKVSGLEVVVSSDDGETWECVEPSGSKNTSDDLLSQAKLTDEEIRAMYKAALASSTQKIAYREFADAATEKALAWAAKQDESMLHFGNRLVAVTEDAIHVSTDKGASWRSHIVTP